MTQGNEGGSEVDKNLRNDKDRAKKVGLFNRDVPDLPTITRQRESEQQGVDISNRTVSPEGGEAIRKSQEKNINAIKKRFPWLK